MIEREQLKHSVTALLDSLAAEHPLGHQDSKAARYVLTTPTGAKLEIMFEKNAKSPANLWVLEKAAKGLAPSALRFTRSPSSSLRAKANAQGAILYCRHSALENMPQLGDADLYRFPIASLTDAGIILDHLLALDRADLR